MGAPVDFDLVGSFNNQRVLPLDPERTLNMFEYVDPLGKKPKALLSTSGLQLSEIFFTTLTGGFRAQFVFQGVGETEPHQYVVIGRDAWRITLGGTANLIFQFTSTNITTYVGIDANTHQVIFVDGQQGWIYDVNNPNPVGFTTSAVPITDPAFPLRPIDVCALDSFFVVANGLTNQFQLSSFDNGLIWGPDNTGTPSTFTMAAGSADIVITFATGFSLSNYQVGTTVRFTGGSLPAELVAGVDYFVVAKTGANIIQVSATDGGAPIVSVAGGSGNITNNGQLQLGQINSHPGNIVACRTLHRRLFLFSANFTEVWENQGIGSNLPFRRNNSLLMEYGTPALGSIATGFDTMFFLSQDRDGLGAVMEVVGTQAIPVSTRALDFALAQFAEDPVLKGVDDARAFLVKENGLIFYRLNFTKANHTYVYDVTLSNPQAEETKYWHEEEMLNGLRHVSQTHAYFGGRNYVGHFSLPKFYILDNSFFTNDGEAIRRMRISRPFVPPGYQRIRIDRFQIDLLQGSPFAGHDIVLPLQLLAENNDSLLTEGGDFILLEQGLVQEVNSDSPTLFLSVSKDGGQTFGYILQLPMGKTGERTFRTLARKLGTIPRGQGFVVKVEFFDDFPFVILGAAWAMEVLPE